MASMFTQKASPRTTKASARTAQMLARAALALACAMLALTMGSCTDPQEDAPGHGGTNGSPSTVETDVTDMMWSNTVYGAQLTVFQIDGETLEADSGYCYAVDVFTSTELEDGHFYRVVADVEYLNGGVAGYVDFPQVKSVQSCEEVSPFELGLASVEDSPYGLSLIGDYADGDVLLYEYNTMAVWKDGAWVHRYHRVVDLADGRRAGVREGVEKSAVLAGAESGLLSCEDYFVLPPAL